MKVIVQTQINQPFALFFSVNLEKEDIYCSKHLMCVQPSKMCDRMKKKKSMHTWRQILIYIRPHHSGPRAQDSSLLLIQPLLISVSFNVFLNHLSQFAFLLGCWTFFKTSLYKDIILFTPFTWGPERDHKTALTCGFVEIWLCLLTSHNHRIQDYAFQKYLHVSYACIYCIYLNKIYIFNWALILWIN